MSTYGSALPTMCYKIINRNFHHSPFLQTLQCDLEKFEVESVRMIEIVLVARSHIMLFLVQHLRYKHTKPRFELY